MSSASGAIDDSSNKLHFVMFPWLAFGHMIPFLELSKSIALKGHKVTFISTPRNIHRLLPKLPQALASSVTFVKIPLLPTLYGLPEDAEATTDITNGEDMNNLKRAFDGLETELGRFLEKTTADWIIYDFCSHWLPPIAAKLGISQAMFSIISSWFFCSAGPTDVMINGSDYRETVEDFCVPPKWVPFETQVVFRLHEAKWLRSSVKGPDSGVSDIYRLGTVISGCSTILVRQSPEIGGEWIHLLQELHGKPVIPVGLLPPSLHDDQGDHYSTSEAWNEASEWLDRQNKRSVVYVAFGSEVTLSRDQVHELALGLELSGFPFFWVLRTASDELPEGFEERVKDRGLVWRSWAPQVRILSHESVGGFVTHCGWSSVIEAIMLGGHPLIMLPLVVDQGLNARVCTELELGIEVPRNEEDGTFSRDSLAETVKILMIGDAGRRFRDRAKELSQLFGDTNLHNQYLDSAIQFLENQKHASNST